MENNKELVTSAITRAHAELELALSELEKMPAFDAGNVAFAAHALNNYLNVTGATIEMVLMRLENFPDEQIRKWLEGAQHTTNLMARIVSQLMNASASTDTRFLLEKVDLPLLVKRCCTYYQRVATRKDIQVIVGASDDVPPVSTDRAAIAAVLDNLLSNAVKFSQPGKKIRVQVRGEDGWAVCDVQDEGPGLGPEDRARLFQRGARLTPRPTGGESSMGYGLAVARELVEKLCGTIWCESVPGQGSCFSFRLPAYREPKP